jgi:predicted DNA-binding transcriptional regulator YafY
MSRGDQLSRQWSILSRLSGGRRSRRELAEELGVSLKTISRDLVSLSVFPIAEEREGIDVFYELVSGARTPSVRFAPDELVALLLSERTIVGALEGSPYAEAVARALAKVALLHRERSDRALARLPEVFQSSFPKPARRTDLQERLHEAALLRRLLRLVYFTAERGRSSERIVEPFFLHLHPHGLHLIGYCRERCDFLYFSVNAIESLEVLDETFDPGVRAFDLEAFLATVFDGRRGTPILDVHLRVKDPTARWARDHFYHSTQEFTEIDGGFELRFRAGAPEAIAARVLSLGPDCEVLGPPALIADVARKARGIMSLYES